MREVRLRIQNGGALTLAAPLPRGTKPSTRDLIVQHVPADLAPTAVILQVERLAVMPRVHWLDWRLIAHAREGTIIRADQRAES